MRQLLKGLRKRLQHVIDRFKHAYHILFFPHKRLLNQYNPLYPDPQHVVNLFENEWISSFPPPFQQLKAGVYPLFEDARLAWGIQQLGGVENKSILELGPLEGGHSYMLEKQGAASVIAIEAHPRAYLRCLAVKQIMKLERVNFLFGDFNEYLRSDSEEFDICIASGVLYHMKNPIELLALISEKCQKLFLWTHYYHVKVCTSSILQLKFSTPYTTEVQGFKHTLYPFKYGASRSWPTFIGGPAKTSCWLSRQEILDGLHHFGFQEIHINFEEFQSPYGPSFALTAKK